MSLPPGLREAVEAEISAVPTPRLTRATESLVARYRGERRVNQAGYFISEDDVAAYAAYRLPATWAALRAAMVEVQRRRPDYEPRSLLDIGAGPGTGLWAARDVWPRMERCHLIERDGRMIGFGQRLLTRVDISQDVSWAQRDALSPWDVEPHDLVAAGYLLNEVPEDQRDDLVDRLWAASAGTLLILEPGTPTGFAIVRQARQQLIDLGAIVTAPCPHQRACPMPPDDWCHFAVRVNRSRIHRHVKHGELAWEDEKFSYVAASRVPGTPIAGRVLRHPRILKGRVVLQLCAPEGLREVIVTRGKDRAGFRRARDLDWGDAVDST